MSAITQLLLLRNRTKQANKRNVQIKTSSVGESSLSPNKTNSFASQLSLRYVCQDCSKKTQWKMGGVVMISQKAIHDMAAQRTVGIQEAVNLMDKQVLVMCSEQFTFLNVQEGSMLGSEKNAKEKTYCFYVSQPEQEQG